MRRVLALSGSVLVLLAAAAPVHAAVPIDFGELRTEVQRVNNAAGATDAIELAGGTVYSLAGGECPPASPNDEDANESGDLDVSRVVNLTISAPADQSATIAVDCPNPSRALEMVAGGTLTLRRVQVLGGRAPEGQSGGGVRAAGDVTLDGASFVDNAAGAGAAGVLDDRGGQPGGSGGAVFAAGTVVVTDSTFTDNRAGDGGNAFNDHLPCDASNGSPGGSGGHGGALSAGGLQIARASFSGNSAGRGGDGGIGHCAAANPGSGGAGAPGGSGGAVSCRMCAGPVAISASAFSANQAGGGGTGGAGEQAPTSAAGDGAAGGPGGDGGAVGVGISSGSLPFLRIENSTFDANGAGAGGAGGPGGTTVVGAGGSGGSGGDGGAGAIAARGPDPGGALGVRLVHATVTDSAFASGGAGAAGANGTPPGSNGTGGASGGGGVFSPRNWGSDASVIGDATAAGVDCWSAAASSSYSASTDATCGFDDASDLGLQPFSAFALGPLAPSGGPPSRVPAATSVLLDRVPPVACSLTTDQRGISRPRGSGCDVGAVEFAAPGLTLGPGPADFGTVAIGASTDKVVTASSDGTADVKIAAVAVSGEASAEFSVAADGCSGKTLAPGAACELTLRFTAATAGARSAQLDVTSDDVAGPDQLALTGTGVAATTPAPSPTPAPTPAPGRAPTISGFKLSPKSFTAKQGSRFRFTSTEAGKATITIERKGSGRRSGKRCVKSSSAPKGKRCTRYTKSGSVKVTVAAGSNSVKFSGKVGGKRLAAAGYRATIVATDADGSSKPKTASFTVKRATR